MLDGDDILLVSDAIQAIKPVSRPAPCADVWRIAAKDYDDETGRIRMSRDAMAAALGRSSDDVSRALQCLDKHRRNQSRARQGKTAKGESAVDFYVEERKIQSGQILGKASTPPRPRNLEQWERLLRRVGDAPPALPKEESIFPDWLPMTAAARRLEFELIKRRRGGSGPTLEAENGGNDV